MYVQRISHKEYLTGEKNQLKLRPLNTFCLNFPEIFALESRQFNLAKNEIHITHLNLKIFFCR